MYNIKKLGGINMGPTLDLAINVGDVFGYINTFFTTMWPLLAVALGIMFAPRVINMIKAVAGGRR